MTEQATRRLKRKRPYQLLLRMDEGEWSILQSSARALGMTETDYLRFMLRTVAAVHQDAEARSQGKEGERDAT